MLRVLVLVSVILFESGLADSDILLTGRNYQMPSEKYQMTLARIAMQFGFRSESHTVSTSDGYLLTLYRIPGRVGEPPSIDKKPVLIQHGILDCADTWVLRGNESIGIMLAEEGYDVWLGNSRGNTHSKDHMFLNADFDSEYWQFTFEEMGEYDMKAVIEYILEETQFDDLTFICHSMGATQMFYALSRHNHFYKDKLNLIVAMAPAITITNNTSPMIKAFDQIGDILNGFLNIMSIDEIFPSQSLQSSTVSLICATVSQLCKLIDYMFADQNPDINDEETFNRMLWHYPAGSSVKTFNHMRQILHAMQFQRFDYESDSDNLFYYNQTAPPKIRLDHIRGMRVAIMAGTLDQLVSPIDVQQFANEIGRNVIFYKEYPLGHGGFQMAKNMTQFTDDIKQLVRENQDLPIS